MSRDYPTEKDLLGEIIGSLDEIGRVLAEHSLDRDTLAIHFMKVLIANDAKSVAAYGREIALGLAHTAYLCADAFSEAYEQKVCEENGESDVAEETSN